MKLIAIDLDGTLLDSAPDLAAAVNAALASQDLPTADEPSVRSWIGDGVDILIERALTAQGGDAVTQRAAALKVFGEVYAAHLYDKSRLYDGVPETLDRLRAAGFTLACVTNKREDFARAILDQSGIADRFALLIGGNTLAAKKPDPLPLLHAARVLGASAADASMVGDSHHDLHAAAAAGFAFYWASFGYCADPGTMSDGSLNRLGRFPDLADFLGA